MSRRTSWVAPRLPFTPWPWLVVRPSEGLANRLRGLSSAMAVARVLRLRLAVHWAPSQGFSSEGFHELFANDLRLWDQDRYQQALRGSAPIASEWLEPRAQRPRGPFDARSALRRIRGRGLVYDDAFRDLDEVLAERGVTGLRRIARVRRRCVRELRPAPAIERRVADFAREHFAGRRVVGVHVRRGDALTSRAAALYRSSSDEAFAAAMSRAVADDPSLRFFLATDCEKTQEAFAERFRGRLVSAPKPFVASVLHAPKQGQADALVDLLLLSRTERILATRRSTFGPMAALMGRIHWQVVDDQSF